MEPQGLIFLWNSSTIPEQLPAQLSSSGVTSFGFRRKLSAKVFHVLLLRKAFTLHENSVHHRRFCHILLAMQHQTAFTIANGTKVMTNKGLLLVIKNKTSQHHHLPVQLLAFGSMCSF